MASKRKSPSGTVKTAGLVLSALRGRSDSIFPLILKLYAAAGARITDTTYGKGSFWKGVDRSQYTLVTSDLKTGVDACALPYGVAEFDMVVFDPPYMHSSGGGSYATGQTAFDTHYRNNAADRGSSGHDQVLALYFDAAAEAHRVLRRKGVYVVKCQDEICANVQRLTHVELIAHFEANGWVCEDLFVLMREGTPIVSRMVRQLHARKNHSYFLVFRRDDSGRAWIGPQAGV